MTGQLIVRVPPPGALARDVTGLASRRVSRVPARAGTLQGRAALAVPGTPGTSATAAVMMAAGPASAWIRICEAIM